MVFLEKLASINFSHGFHLEEKSEETKTVSTIQKIGFHQPEWRILLKNTFLLDGKKLTGVSEK